MAATLPAALRPSRTWAKTTENSKHCRWAAPVDEELELGLAAPLEQRDHQGPIPEHLPHHHLLQVKHVGHLLLHVLRDPHEHVSAEPLKLVHLLTNNHISTDRTSNTSTYTMKIDSSGASSTGHSWYAHRCDVSSFPSFLFKVFLHAAFKTLVALSRPGFRGADLPRWPRPCRARPRTPAGQIYRRANSYYRWVYIIRVPSCNRLTHFGGRETCAI